MTNPNELTKGTKFHSPRKSEGIVVAVCDYGKCVHDKSRDESVHVRGSYWSELFQSWEETQFFVNLPRNYDIEEWGAELA
jgi:hypothetical protein